MKAPITIVLADDHAVVRKGTREFLEGDASLRVLAETGDGNQALALAVEYRPDVLVLDIQMPGKSGIEVTRQVRMQKLRCGILIVTAFDDAPYVKSTLQAGVNGYILKTAEPEELIAAVHEGQLVLDRHLQFTIPSPVSSDVNSSLLTLREIEILQRIALGLTNKAIAMELNISDRTVQGHIANIFEKLHAGSRTDAVMIALRAGWIANT